MALCGPLSNLSGAVRERDCYMALLQPSAAQVEGPQGEYVDVKSLALGIQVSIRDRLGLLLKVFHAPSPS